MDPAEEPLPDSKDLPAIVEMQSRQMDQLASMVQQLLSVQQQQPPPAPVVLPPSAASSGSGLRLSLPTKFDGEPKSCRGFLTQCSLYLEMLPDHFPTERSKVAFMVSLLSGKALAWATPLWDRNDIITTTVLRFFTEFRNVFEEPARSSSAETALLNLAQGNSSVGTYALQFRTLASELSWNNEALCATFKRGLASDIKDVLATRDLPTNLTDLIHLATRIDVRFSERQEELSLERSTVRTKRFPRLAPIFQIPPLSPTEAPTEEAMQVARTRLTPQERVRRRNGNLCLYCASTEHFLKDCPLRPPMSGKRSHLVNVGEALLGVSSASPRISVPIQISFASSAPISLSAFLDTGSAGNFIRASLIHKFNIPVTRLLRPLYISTVNGEKLDCAIHYRTEPLNMRVGVLHVESIEFLVLPYCTSEVLLGLPWLQHHGPTLDWTSGEIKSWGSDCHLKCLKHGFSKPSTLPPPLPGLPSAYQDFADVFCKKQADVLPPHRPYDCPIDLMPGTTPPRGRIYPLSTPETQAMSEYIKENLQKGFIRKSSSPAGAGFFFVGKKDGSLRPCIDYRGLNKITIKNRYPLPLIAELFDRLRGANIFTKLDLRGAYNLVRIREGDEWKTAFNTRDGHFEYLVMPFGLCNAPAVFQEFVNDIFRDLLYSCVVVYLDDILIFSTSLVEHRYHVRQVLQRLRTHHLYAKLEKCLFNRSELPFLGYIISGQGLQMDPNKLSAVLDWPRPTGLRAIQRFLGFANYYRQFIHHFSSLVAPIVALTKKDANPRSWTPQAEEAFTQLKRSFASAPVLSRPDPSKPFCLEVDASSVGAGAVLTQKNSSGKTLSCGFFSRTFSPAERNYSIGDRELLAIKLALEEWRHLLEGALHQIVVFTDHKNLSYLQTAQRLNPRQARWSLFFARFNFVIHFRPASKNIRADALSRSSDLSDLESVPQHIVSQENLIYSAPAQLLQAPPGKTFIPPRLRLKILKWGHSSRVAGHAGIKKSTQLISRRYWWPTLPKDIKDFVLACPVCARDKTPRLKPAGLLLPLPVPESPWSHIAMDFITDLPSSHLNTVIWVVVDRFSKMAHFIPLPGLPSAPQLAKFFFNHIFRLHGLPTHIVSDRGVQFVSKFWRALCSQMKIKLDFSSAYHPQSNGQVERINQVLGDYLRHFVSSRQDDWVDLLPWAEFSYNFKDSESTQKSPFFIVYGRHPLPPLPLPSSSSGVPAVDELSQDLSTIWRETQQALLQSISRMKLHADKKRRVAPTFSPGDKVWLSSKYVRFRIPCYKLGPRFLGPYTVKKQINPVSYQLHLPPSLRISNSFHVSLLKPAVFNRFSPKTVIPTPVSGTSDVFSVKTVLDCKVSKGKKFFLVDWEGCGPEDRSWEPEENILDRSLIQRFLGAKKRGRPKGGGYC